MAEDKLGIGGQRRGTGAAIAKRMFIEFCDEKQLGDGWELGKASGIN